MNIIKYINQFVFLYPCIMSIILMVGGLIFHNTRKSSVLLNMDNPPFVSILVPCFNEQYIIRNTIDKLDKLNYKSYEIIAINDGSSDNTSPILKELAEKYERLRVIDLKVNKGKANALHLGLLASKGEFLMCVDADAYLEENALNYMIPHFITPNNSERVGVVTGCPIVRNRESLLAKIQLCEFSSIIGLNRRSQRVLGKVMTISGVVCAFRKKALLDVGLWEIDMVTEDISITFQLQKRFWDVRYEPNALCYMLVPETIKGIFNQRKRWSLGGHEAIIRNINTLKDIRQRRLIPIFLEQILSTTWAFLWSSLLIISIIQVIIHKDLSYLSLVSSDGLFLAVICLIQFAITMLIDNSYDKDSFKYYFYSIHYAFLYWYLNALVTLTGMPKALSLKTRKGEYATWTSPDRGVVDESI